MDALRVNRILKAIVAVFAVIIVLLVGILVVVQPAKGPTVARQAPPAVSADGHVAVASPLPNDLLSSPVDVRGTVTGGGWFFEASFPARVLDGDGALLGAGSVKPVGDPSQWMSTGTVPFAAAISFTAPKYATGTVVLSKDNPSGLSQNAGELRIPVRFR